MSGLELIHFIRPCGWRPYLCRTAPWLWRSSRRPAGDWERICDPHLLKWLSRGKTGDGGRSRAHWLAGLALLIAILALSGPSWQRLPYGAYSARGARVVALDLSNSMLAEDLRPNRLTRARFRSGGPVQGYAGGPDRARGYAGDAYVVSPLTTDTNTIANLLPALQPDVIPVSGSRADLALGLAATLLNGLDSAVARSAGNRFR
jgi:Ca-activated chloride channel family protein